MVDAPDELFAPDAFGERDLFENLILDEEVASIHLDRLPCLAKYYEGTPFTVNEQFDVVVGDFNGTVPM